MLAMSLLMADFVIMPVSAGVLIYLLIRYKHDWDAHTQKKGGKR